MGIGLLLADDHWCIRDALRETFAVTDIRIVVEAAAPSQVEPLSRHPAVDVVLLATFWGRPGTEDGIGLLRDIRSRQARLPILMYSVYDRASIIAKCRRLGANGYVVKGVDDRRLPKVVRAVHAGDCLWADQRQRWRL